MSDMPMTIVERLRDMAHTLAANGRDPSGLHDEAADRIEQLERELAEARSATAQMDEDTADAARVYPIARPVRSWFSKVLDAENRQIVSSVPPEYGVQIVHALNSCAVTETDASADPFNCPKCGAHDFGLNRPRCPHCLYVAPL